MKKTVLTFGLIAGVIISVLISVTIPFGDKIGFDRGVYVGYTTMLMAFLLVFFGIRSYRENVGGGEISFGKAFQVGILITLITCAFYVVTWEVIYFNFMTDFTEKYAAYLTEKARASGASPEQLSQQIEHVKEVKKLLDNPFLSAVIIFVSEPFPVGLAMTLISAAILRKRRRAVEVPV